MARDCERRLHRPSRCGASRDNAVPSVTGRHLILRHAFIPARQRAPCTPVRHARRAPAGHRVGTVGDDHATQRVVPRRRRRSATPSAAWRCCNRCTSAPSGRCPRRRCNWRSRERDQRRCRRAPKTDAEITLHTRRPGVAGRTPNQRQYLHHILDHDITFGIGPAGTGKTFLAVACAVDALERSTGAAHRADPPGGRGRRAARLPARRPGAEGRPVPAAAVRRAVRPDGLRPRRARRSRRARSRSRRWRSCAAAR